MFRHILAGLGMFDRVARASLWHVLAHIALERWHIPAHLRAPSRVTIEQRVDVRCGAGDGFGDRRGIHGTFLVKE
jgi:hypothetical protein